MPTTCTEGDGVARRPRGQLRQDILDTVIELLIDTGDVSSVSIDAVVDRVGCTPPALYYYFPTKSDLLFQACDAEFAKLTEHLEEFAERNDSDTVTRMVRRGAALLQWAAEHPALYRILFMGSGRDGVVRGSTVEHAALQGAIENTRDAMAEGLLKPDLDPMLSTLSMWGVLHGFASMSVSFPDLSREVIETAMTTATTPLLQSIMTPRGLDALAAAVASGSGETVQKSGADRP